MKEIDFINDRINHKEVEIPSYLYKYRPFDEYKIALIANNNDNYDTATRAVCLAK